MDIRFVEAPVGQPGPDHGSSSAGFGSGDANFISFALSTARIGTWELDLDTHDARRSLLHDQIFGYPELQPRWNYEMFLEHVVPGDRDEVDRAFREAIAKQGDWSFECRIRRPDGECRWIWAAGRHLPDQHGRGARLAGIVQDITDRKRADEALRQSEQNYRELVKHAPAAIYEIDFQTRRFLSVNDAMCQMTGYSREELLAINPFDLLDHRSAVLFRKRVEQCLSGETPDSNIEYTARVKGGGTINVILNVTFARDAAGRPTGASVLGYDITERKRMEQALRDSEERWRMLGALTNEGIIILQSDGVALDVNEQFARMHGYLPAELLGKSIDPLIAPEDRDRVYKSAASGQDVMQEQRDVRKDGTPITVEVRAHSIAYAGKEARVAVLRDITGRKRVEEALRSANRQLVEGDRRKNEFLATLSHELRNPLAPIANSLYILERAVPGGDEARHAQAIIDRQVRQLRRLVDDLLDVTRIARNKIRLQRERLELNELVRRTLEDHRSLFSGREVTLEFDPAPRRLFVNGDWSRLGQSLGNLLQNAAKFTGREGRVRISLSTDAAGTSALLRVADTGIGMSPQVLSRLFEPFMQADIALDRSGGGLGLGLALVKGIVELHGGEISAHSAGLGKGTEFVMRLPLDVTAPARNEVKRTPPVAVPRRVLIIEDNIDGAESLRMLLGFFGHDLAVAPDGAAGIALAREFRPDVLLCDIGLPEMDGYAVARTFRADPALRDTYLVALSGYALPHDLQQAADAGFDLHLSKPACVEKLNAVLTDLPARRKG